MHHVEATLRAKGVAKDVVAVARAQQDGRKALLAFYIPTSSESSAKEAEALCACASDEFPAYSRPEAFFPVDVFPLTSSGKVHRGVVISQSAPKERKQFGARCNAARREVLEL